MRNVRAGRIVASTIIYGAVIGWLQRMVGTAPGAEEAMDIGHVVILFGGY